jgi:hypothetical protein
VVQFFRTKLGYGYLGHWQDRVGNSNVEQDLLRDWLRRQGHSEKIIGRVLYEPDKARAVSGSKSLYDRNRAVYELLRYGVKVRPDVGENNVTVWLVDWKQAENNDFAIAEEVTVAAADAKAHAQTPGCGHLRERHRAGRAGVETLDRLGCRGHPPEPRQPEEDFIERFFSTMQLSWPATTRRACATERSRRRRSI